MSQQNEFWVLPPVAQRSGFDKLSKKSAPVPQPGPGEVLVAVHAVSLNYRDLTISKKQYPLFLKDGELVPTSDGAGEVVGLGSGVTKWKQGDRVAGIFTRDQLHGNVPTDEELQSGFGGAIDGFLTKYIAVPATALVRVPDYLSYEEAATLPCAAVTAYNGLYGLASQQLNAGQTVLVQGTGGVSIFGLQLALAAGAKVIATSSSDDKIKKVLDSIPAHHRDRVTFLNYKKTPNWGAEAKKLTNGVGVDFVIEVGGAGTVEQSFAAIRKGGIIALIGHVAAHEGDLPHVPLLTLQNGAVFRGILIGSRQQFNDMLKIFDTEKIKPIVDRVFPFEQAPDAYAYQWSGAHVGKVVIKVQ